VIDNSFRCDADGCKARKGEGNHWLVYDRRAMAKGMFIVRYWHEELAKTWGHLCSDQCAIKLMVKTVRGPQIDLCSRCGHAAHAEGCSECPSTSRCALICGDCKHKAHEGRPCISCGPDGPCYADISCFTETQ